MKKILSTFLFLVLLNSCSTYKLKVQQGNALSNESIAMLKKGMSKGEVVSILGNPLLQDNFRQNRWDYVYYTKRGNTSSKQQGVTLLFQNEQLIDVKR